MMSSTEFGTNMKGAKYNYMKYISLLFRVENIFNLVGPEEYNIELIVPLVSILYS